MFAIPFPPNGERFFKDEDFSPSRDLDSRKEKNRTGVATHKNWFTALFHRTINIKVQEGGRERVVYLNRNSLLKFIRRNLPSDPNQPISLSSEQLRSIAQGLTSVYYTGSIPLFKTSLQVQLLWYHFKSCIEEETKKASKEVRKELHQIHAEWMKDFGDVDPKVKRVLKSVEKEMISYEQGKISMFTLASHLVRQLSVL